MNSILLSVFPTVLQVLWGGYSMCSLLGTGHIQNEVKVHMKAHQNFLNDG